ncbi:MAG TPA: phospholipid carrier-dependent glycosyltransferase [Steroidobacteraceae bacterium]|nr:phospholipid carrier-dependent glycosyltransferase [Steroidobacteraceae bacterium]
MPDVGTQQALQPLESRQAAGLLPRETPSLARIRLANLGWILLPVAVALWFVLLASRPLFRPDEGRYAEIPREMVATGDWLVPRLNGLVYVEKPPLQYWLTAASFQAFGSSAGVARLTSGLAAVFCVALTGWAARRLWGRGAAITAGALCVSAPLYFLVGQQLTLDMLFTFFLTGGLVAFCAGQSVRDDRARCLGWMLLCWVSIAAAVMVKGIAALAIPGLVLIVYSLWQRDGRVWSSAHVAPGLAMCLVLAAPWFIAVGRAVPGFNEFFFIHEHLLRYATLSAHRYEPWWFFIPVVLGGVAPWIPQTVRAWRTRNEMRTPRGGFDARRLLWAWVWVTLIFFSASKSKLVPYVLPMVPALALLVAGSKARLHVRDARWSAIITLAAAAAVGIGIVVFRLVAHQEKQLALVDLATPALVATTLALALGGAAGLWLAYRQGAGAGLSGIAIGWYAANALIVGWAAAAASPLYSSETLAAAIATRTPPPTHVYSVGYYEQTLPFYLGRTIEIVDFRGELDFGLRLDPSRAFSLENFRQRWQAEPDSCAIMQGSTYDSLAASGLPMTVIKRDPRYVLVARQ